MLILLLLPLGISAQEVDAQEEEQTWKVNLKDADIRAFIAQVADITGYSFVIDPRVKGKVTVLSDTPMNRREIYDMFLSVLQVHGFAAIPSEEVIKIVQQNDAKQSAENLDRFETVPPAQLVTRVIQVHNADALELVPILRPMVAQYGHLAGVAAANALIVSDHAANIERIERIVRELDSPSNFEMEVVQLEEAWVGDMVKLLEELAPAELGEANARAAAAKFSVVADERSNRLIIRGDETFRNKMRELIAKLDQPAENAGDTRVIRLNHADAESLAEILNGIMGQVTGANGEAAATGAPSAEVEVFADTGLNALVVRAEPALLEEVEFIVNQLDVRRAQVLIEAAIVEISNEAGEALGVQWAVGDQSSDSTTPVAGTNFSNVGLSLSSVLGAIAEGTLISPATGGISIGFGQVDRDGISWGALIQALSSSSYANLLSTPSIITLDNSESQITVGQNVPFKTGQAAVSGNGLTNPFTTIERQDVGLTLKVTPSISADNVVKLEVEQTTEDIAAAIDAAADIVTNKREIKTTVLVDDGETIVLGGLIREDYRTNVSKVPILGDIPFIGALFRSEEEERVKRNLLVFLRPTILREQGDAAEVSQDRYEQLWKVNVSGTEFMDEVDDDIAPPEDVPPMESIFRGNQLRIVQ